LIYSYIILFDLVKYVKWIFNEIKSFGNGGNEVETGTYYPILIF